MRQVSDIIARALRLIGVIDANEAVSPMDSDTAIIALNSMCRRWEANGMAMGWNDVSRAEDAMPGPPEADQAIAYNLALHLAPEYGVSPSGVVVQYASDGLAELRRDRYVEMPLTQVTDAPCGPGLVGRWNIRTDSPV